MLSCSDINVVFCFAVINNSVAVTVKTISNARAGFFRKWIFKGKVVYNFRWRFENGL